MNFLPVHPLRCVHVTLPFVQSEVSKVRLIDRWLVPRSIIDELWGRQNCVEPTGGSRGTPWPVTPCKRHQHRLVNLLSSPEVTRNATFPTSLGFPTFFWLYHKKHRGGSMRVTILPYAILLTKAQRVTVRMMANGWIVAWVLSLRCFLL